MPSTQQDPERFASELLIRDVKAAARRADHAEVARLLAECANQVGAGAIYAEILSWAARAYLSKGQLSDAGQRAAEAYTLSAHFCADDAKKSMDQAEAAALDVALGASIEVQAQIAGACEGTAAAVRYLQSMLDAHGLRDCATRIRKNLLCLTLPGQPAPPMEWTPLASFRCQTNPMGNRPTLLFFWAHWCSDSRAQGRTLSRLFGDGAHADLALVAPTRLFGFIHKGVAAPEADERQQIETVLDAEYAWMRQRPETCVLLSPATVARYGASTFPTLGIVDGAGIVQGYHPGTMKLEALQEWLTRCIDDNELSGNGA